MTAVYKGFRTRDIAPRILPGKAIPKPSRPGPTPPAPKDPETRTAAPTLTPSQK